MAGRALLSLTPALLAAALLSAALLSASLPAAAPAAPAASQAALPRCFGAASRDQYRPCRNPRLRYDVIPTPDEALLTPNAFCDPLGFPGLNICGFGAPPAGARASVALVGNSHAGHWRAALAVAARALDWQGISITRSSCPFTRATTDLAQPERAQCTRWRDGVLAWFRRHPEIHTVFTSNQPTIPLVRRGQSVRATEVAGYISMWHSLPSSVRHIVVIRDNPYNRLSVLTCVEAAIAAHEDAGMRCAEPRSQALQYDPAVVAAQELHSARVHVIDLTRFFCSSELCYPVIGGALVYRDADHLTRAFATTLGPYLLAEVQRLLGRWRRGSV